MNKFIYLLILIVFSHIVNLKSMESQTQACDYESLSDQNLRDKLRKQFLFDADKLLAGKWDPTEEDYIDLCLNGKKYTAVNRLGGGVEGNVFEIIDANGNKFALKEYRNPAYAKIQENDLLAMNKANASRSFLNIPIEVNEKYLYSIFPKLYMQYSIRPNKQLWNNFMHALNEALATDGLTLGDNLSEENYMYDEKGKLWRIDFGSLKVLNTPKKIGE